MYVCSCVCGLYKKRRIKDPITYRIKIMIHRDNKADKRGYHCCGGHFLGPNMDPNHLCHLNDTMEIHLRQTNKNIHTQIQT